MGNPTLGEIAVAFLLVSLIVWGCLALLTANGLERINVAGLLGFLLLAAILEITIIKVITTIRRRS